VLLLNAVLTVEEGRPGSHIGFGWEAFTDEIIRMIAESEEPVVFMLWGAQAAAKRAVLGPAALGRHAVLLANHPSPLSARRGPVPFIGCGHFGRASACLAARGGASAPVDWGR
jgi:uracil-DNA glycosylase